MCNCIIIYIFEFYIFYKAQIVLNISECVFWIKRIGVTSDWLFGVLDYCLCGTRKFLSTSLLIALAYSWSLVLLERLNPYEKFPRARILTGWWLIHQMNITRCLTIWWIKWISLNRALRQTLTRWAWLMSLVLLRLTESTPQSWSTKCSIKNSGQRSETSFIPRGIKIKRRWRHSRNQSWPCRRSCSVLVSQSMSMMLQRKRTTFPFNTLHSFWRYNWDKTKRIIRLGYMTSPHMTLTRTVVSSKWCFLWLSRSFGKFGPQQQVQCLDKRLFPRSHWKAKRTQAWYKYQCSWI